MMIKIVRMNTWNQDEDFQIIYNSNLWLKVSMLSDIFFCLHLYLTLEAANYFLTERLFDFNHPTTHFESIDSKLTHRWTSSKGSAVTSISIPRQGSSSGKFRCEITSFRYTFHLRKSTKYTLLDVNKLSYCLKALDFIAFLLIVIELKYFFF